MQNESEKWQELWRDPLHVEEIKLTIAGEEYTHADIIAGSAKTSGGMFSDVKSIIGNCASGQIDFEIYPKGTIPRQAEIKVYKRLVSGANASDWMQNGVYYISTRQQNKLTGTLVIHGFDAMLKSCDTWLTSDYDKEYWPKSEQEAVDDIAKRIGVEIDPRTKLNNVFPVDYPVDEDGDMLMIDILEGIACANCGNWIITDEGKLRLIKIGEEPPETNYLVSEYGDAITFGGVRILVR